MAPKISVLMGIYNCASTLPAAIECILNQTVQDFELIMCEDGSKDDTYRVAQEYQKKHPDKIVLLKNEKNMGLNATLNRCLAVARGAFISRMDGDDLCEPDRFEKELAALDETPEYAIVSFADRTIRPLVSCYPWFSAGNFGIDCEFKENGAIDLLIHYCPNRYA